MGQLLERYQRQAADLTPALSTSEDLAYDLAELMEAEQRQWGPRLRVIKSMGEPMAGLGGFTGPPIPNSEPVVAPTAVTATAARAALYTLNSTGSLTWMWVPPGNLRAGQAWLVWASGTATTTTSSTVGWTTAIGQTQINQSSTDSNTVLAANGALTPGFNGTVAWNYRAHMTVRSVGAAGTVVGSHEVNMSNNVQGSATNAVTGMGGVVAGVTLDTTQGFFWAIDITNSVTTNSVQLLQFVILSCD